MGSSNFWTNTQDNNESRFMRQATAVLRSHKFSHNDYKHPVGDEKRSYKSRNTTRRADETVTLQKPKKQKYEKYPFSNTEEKSFGKNY